MWRVTLALVIVSAFALAAGQGSSSGAAVRMASSDSFGSYLVNASGMSLYMLSADSKDTSTCTGACAQAWPPLTVSGSPSAGSGVAGSLLGTLKRADGSMQVTYNGIPLYTFVKDTAAGDTNGEGITAHGGTWTLVSPYGSAIAPPAPPASQKAQTSTQPTASNVSQAELTKLRADGKPTFDNICSACHGSSGEGGKGPAFVGFATLKDSETVVRHIYFGGHFMPPFGKVLSREQIAAVATYIRTSWGNEYGAVIEKEVDQILPQ